MKKIIITIDGHAGSGKSTTAQKVSKILKYKYVNSGYLYRAITYSILHNKIKFKDPYITQKHLDSITIEYNHDYIQDKISVKLNNQDIISYLKDPHIESNVAEVSANKDVRAKIFQIQKNLGIQKEIIMDGRDIGTKIFPEAELKIFMTADIESRVLRMKEFYLQKSQKKEHKDIKKQIIQRDILDQTRTHSPLIKPEDAIVLDTTHSTIEEQVNKIVELARQKMK